MHNIFGFDFMVTKADWQNIFDDIVRYWAHFVMISLVASLIDTDERSAFFSIKLIKTLIFTAISVCVYHIIVKKVVYAKTIAKEREKGVLPYQ